MQALFRPLTSCVSVFRNIPSRIAQVPNVLNLSAPTTGLFDTVVNQWCIIPVRTVIRCHFPRPNERMRIKKHGYKARLSTRPGQRVLMRRILKGRHNLSH